MIVQFITNNKIYLLPQFSRGNRSQKWEGGAWLQHFGLENVSGNLQLIFF